MPQPIKVNPRKERAVREAMLRDRYRVGNNQSSKIIAKYIDCEFVDYGSRRRTRKLSAQEIAEFRRVIDLKIACKLRTAGARLDVAGHALEVLAKTPTDSDVVQRDVFSPVRAVEIPRRQLSVHQASAATVKRTTSRRASAVSRRAVV